MSGITILPGNVHTAKFLRHMDWLRKEPVDGKTSSYAVLMALAIYHKALLDAVKSVEIMAESHMSAIRARPGITDIYATRYFDNIRPDAQPADETCPGQSSGERVERGTGQVQAAS